ncbi:MAG: AAA family ATPase, partial [Bacilli bacterium]|nr:AAA family ATPase [Bacilli bacterium]
EKVVDEYLEEYDNKAACATNLFEWSCKKRILLDCDVVSQECFQFLNQKEKEEEEKVEPLQEANFDDLVGLDVVKEEIESLKNYLSFRKKVDLDQTYLNMFFLGNPGTGKTTVARMYADILYHLGYIKENKVKEIIPTDLMGQFVGHTKEQTRKIFNEAKNGILFIDEAYLINNDSYKGDNSPYMKEAIVELIKYLEDPEHVVIFAGYPREMRKLYETNPGIKSRIAKEIYFDDYKTEQLIEIIEKKLAKYHLKVDAKAKVEMKKVIELHKQQKDFGNARFCEQYVQKIIINHANRKLKNENFVITVSDVKLKEKVNCVKMGFVGV